MDEAESISRYGKRFPIAKSKTTSSFSQWNPLQNRRKNLTCVICLDILTTPKILPCFHTFCLACLQKLVSVVADTSNDHPAVLTAASFRCPTCRKDIEVPHGGPRSFQSNMYITDGELERARHDFPLCRLHANYDEPLTFFCVTCDDAICMRCKMTHHESHRCEDLTKGMGGGNKKLAGAKRHLDDAVRDLEKSLLVTERNIYEVEKKRADIIEHVNAQHDNLISIITRYRDSAIKEVDRRSEDIQKSLKAGKLRLDSDLTSCLHELEKIQHATSDGIDKRPRLVRDLLYDQASEVAKLGREESKRVMSASQRQRPGLACSLDPVQKDVIQQLLGQPITLTLLGHETGMEFKVKERITRAVRCVEDGIPRHVLALCVTNDGNIHCMYTEESPACRQWGKVTIAPVGVTIKSNKVNEEFVLRKFSKGEKVCISHRNVCNTTYFNSKSGSEVQLLYTMEDSTGDNSVCNLLEVGVQQDPVLLHPKVTTQKSLHILNTRKPVAFDVARDSNLIAVVEEMEEEEAGEKRAEASQPTSVSPSRCVRLYRREEEDNIGIYLPANPLHFFPVDVCFWRRGGQEKLVVADYTSDILHVLDVHVDSAAPGVPAVIQHEGYVACSSSHGDVLIKPSALDTDTGGRLWIGCGDGWIYRCEALPVSNGEVLVAHDV